MSGAAALGGHTQEYACPETLPPVEFVHRILYSGQGEGANGLAGLFNTLRQ